jgi:hypothetical protein
MNPAVPIMAPNSNMALGNSSACSSGLGSVERLFVSVGMAGSRSVVGLSPPDGWWTRW